MKLYKTLEGRRKACKFLDAFTEIGWCVTIILMTYCLITIFSVISDNFKEFTPERGIFFAIGVMIFFGYAISCILITIKVELSTIGYHLRFVSQATKMREEDN